MSYWSRNTEWDKKGILDCFSLRRDRPHFQFREAAQKYQLIPEVQQPVIVPYGGRGRELVATLHRMSEPPGRGFDRRVQRYVVGLYAPQFNRLRENQTVSQYHERFWVLENESAYDEYVGLKTDAAGFDPALLCI